jgi:hypothetical protein
MTIILALCIPLSFIAGGFVAYKGVHLGLRWQTEIKKEKEPSLANPLKPLVDPIVMAKGKKSESEQANVLREWIIGEEEG